jgi:hypothetical protein
VPGIVALVLILVSACSSSKSPEPSNEDSGVGKVVALTGKVTAQASPTSVTRTLAVGYPVGSSDLIETAADASAVIELFHNNARWSLEGGIKQRVDESVAWKLPKQDAAAEIEHATSSAGRHADRQAADTQITAQRDLENAQVDADREAARRKLQQLQREKAEQNQRVAAAKDAAAKAERKQGVNISKECMENPLARGCDGPSEDFEVKTAREQMRRWADELCACKDKACAAKVDEQHQLWRSVFDNKHPATSPKGKEVAAATSDSVKRIAACRAKL